MNKYKNVLISALCSMVSVVLFFAVAKPNLYSFPSLMLLIAIVGLYGAYLGLKGVRSKELTALSSVCTLFGVAVALAAVGILWLEMSPI